MAAFFDIKKFFKALLYFTLGVVSWIAVIIYIILSAPIFVYRVFVTTFCVGFSPNIREPIYRAHFAATDFIPKFIRHSYRCTGLSTYIFKGTISPIDFFQVTETRWLTKRNEHGKIMIPELQQYMHNFMGFMFWRKDDNFKLTNHVYLHDIGNQSSDESSESFIYNLMEDLLNKCFSLKRSPWEMHLVNNYRNRSVCNESMSVVILRFHHAIADGVSLLNVLGDIIYKNRIEDLKLVIPRPKPKRCLEIGCVLNLIPNIMQMVCDSGYMLALRAQKYKIPWLVPDAVKANRQIFVRSTIIPVGYIKRIKSKFGVRFSAVVLSCLSAAVSKSIKSGETTLSWRSDSMPIFIPIPKWSGSKSLGVFSSGVLLDLPLTCNINAVERLHRCQKLLHSAKQSTLPFLLNLIGHLVNSHPSIICRFLAFSVKIPIFLSIFPMPDDDAQWNEKNSLLGFDGTLGCQIGDVGVGVFVSSCNGSARISITSEAALMGKDDLNALISTIEDELHQLDNWTLPFHPENV